MPGKFKVRWLGRYKVLEVKDNEAIRLSTLDNAPLKDLVNGSKLKHYKVRMEPFAIRFLEIQGDKDGTRQNTNGKIDESIQKALLKTNFKTPNHN